MKSRDLPHAQAFFNAKKCGARARRNNHQPCRQPAMKNGRCRLHGGLSTGPRTHQGKDRAAMANFKHGNYTRYAILERKFVQQMMHWKGDEDVMTTLK